MLFSEKKKKDSDEEAQNGDMSTFFVDFAKNLSSNQLRAVGLYGDVNEQKCSDALYGLLQLNAARELVNSDPEDPDSELIEVVEPIDFYISTHGGHATEMFSLYDMMRVIRQETPLHTHGLGKVMSAGVLLLAAGTKGQRRIGRNCRVMIHGVISGQQGHLHDVENEFEEAKMTQKSYVKALAEETDMTARYIKKLMDKKTNVYLDAQKAVELGIADIVF